MHKSRKLFCISWSHLFRRGKCLGGSSTRNNLVYNRATIGTMSKWTDEVGDASYLWQNTEPYFKKSSRFSAPNTATMAKNVSIEYDQAALDAPFGPVDFGYPNYIYSIGVMQLRLSTSWG